MMPEEEEMKFLTGGDYPWLCSKCRGTVDAMAMAMSSGPDTDDNEAPLMAVGDLGLYCGGRVCWDSEFDGYGFREIWKIVDVLKAHGETAAVRFARKNFPDAILSVTEELIGELAAEVALREWRIERIEKSGCGTE